MWFLFPYTFYDRKGKWWERSQKKEKSIIQKLEFNKTAFLTYLTILSFLELVTPNTRSFSVDKDSLELKIWIFFSILFLSTEPDVEKSPVYYCRNSHKGLFDNIKEDPRKCSKLVKKICTQKFLK